MVAEVFVSQRRTVSQWVNGNWLSRGYTVLTVRIRYDGYRTTGRRENVNYCFGENNTTLLLLFGRPSLKFDTFLPNSVSGLFSPVNPIFVLIDEQSSELIKTGRPENLYVPYRSFLVNVKNCYLKTKNL